MIVICFLIRKTPGGGEGEQEGLKDKLTLFLESMFKSVPEPLSVKAATVSFKETAN